ncbi:beclin-1-like protein isoform X2 [Halyomorpha halys]|uniref:beclin-1-like protein isoform X2 n=1 Tax=Halyomorpha halys TaxID=286706 RepID=UPI0034D2CA6B
MWIRLHIAEFQRKVLLSLRNLASSRTLYLYRMAGVPNKDLEQDGFEMVVRDTDSINLLRGFEVIEKEPIELLENFEALGLELELDFEVLFIGDLFEDIQDKEKDKKDKRLDEIEGSCWSHYATNIINFSKNGGNYNILTQFLQYGLSRIKKIKTNQMLERSFIIVKDCTLVMINGKRFGYKPEEDLNWAEMNLALVEATALLCILSDRIKIKFKNFFPVPHNLKSFIIDLSDQRILPLYGEGKLSKFKNKELDDALVAFLDCVKQLNAGTKSITPDQNMPHLIENDKLKDPVTDKLYSVKLQETKNIRHWSRAMMFLFFNLQWLLKWVTLYKTDLGPVPTPDQLGQLMRRFKNMK